MIKIVLTCLLSLITIKPFTSTGNNFPGTAEQTGSGTSWTTEGNVSADDGSDATCNAASQSFKLIARNFGFSLPAGSTINGILVRVEASEHSGGTEALKSILQNATAAEFGTEKAAAVEGNISGTVKLVYTYGSTSDLWGATITEAIVEDVDFGVRLYFSTAHDVRIDYVTMAVEYTAPASRRVLIISKTAKNVSVNISK